MAGAAILNNALRLRAEKNKWYNLQGSFRRDQYFSDYDLLANPLNPPTSTPSIPVLSSPNAFDTTRRTTDFDLTLLPQSRVSLRLGYSHNNMTGPVYTSIHEGTEGPLLQPWNTTMNSYRLGADWRMAPRTVLSYDQFFDYYRGDTDTQLGSFASALLSGRRSGAAGPIHRHRKQRALRRQPPATSLISPSGILTDVSCSAYFSYQRNQRIRTSTPTERLGFRSNFFPRVDLVASFSYSDAEMNTPLDESFDGLITRTSTRAFLGTGTADASRISDVFDLEATVHLSKHLRLIDKFYFWAYRIPQGGNFSEVDSDCTNPATCTLLTPLSATAPTSIPTLAQSSFNQSLKRDQSELAWDISKKAGARVGFRYGDRVFNRFLDFSGTDTANAYSTTGEDHFVVDEYTTLLGFWARPTAALRLNFDLEHTNYDQVIVRMAPRKESRYRFQTNYMPRQWAVLGASITSSKTPTPTRPPITLAITATMESPPRTHARRFGIDLADNYNDVIQNALICFTDTPPVGGNLPFVTNATACPGPIVPPATVATNPLLADSFYTNNTNFGMATVRFNLDKRTSANVGGSITNVNGSVPQFNILQPQGTAQYSFYQPVAYLRVDLGHKLAWNTGWNYYQYNEGSFVGPTAPRYFHANTLTESLRYAF